MWRKRVRVLVEGDAEGPLLVYDKPISFYGEVDSTSGVLKPLGPGASVAGKLLAFPRARGSTVGSYVLYSLKHYGAAPLALVVSKADPVLVAGCVISQIPLAEGLSEEDFARLKTYSRARLRSSEGLLEAWP